MSQLFLEVVLQFSLHLCICQAVCSSGKNSEGIREGDPSSHLMDDELRLRDVHACSKLQFISGRAETRTWVFFFFYSKYVKLKKYTEFTIYFQKSVTHEQ